MQKLRSTPRIYSRIIDLRPNPEVIEGFSFVDLKNNKCDDYWFYYHLLKLNKVVFNDYFQNSKTLSNYQKNKLLHRARKLGYIIIYPDGTKIFVIAQENAQISHDTIRK